VSCSQETDEDGLYRSMREYARVSAFLPVRVRPVPAKDWQNVRSRTVVESALTSYPEMPQVDDQALSTCLQILNSKLDSIIRLIASPMNGNKEVDFEKVNISAGGLSISCDEAHAPGSLLEMRLMLPTAPLMIFYIYGSVVKCEMANQRYDIFVEFTEIDDDIREQIAKYVFQKQREILRKNRSRAD